MLLPCTVVLICFAAKPYLKGASTLFGFQVSKKAPKLTGFWWGIREYNAYTRSFIPYEPLASVAALRPLGFHFAFAGASTASAPHFLLPCHWWAPEGCPKKCGPSLNALIEMRDPMSWAVHCPPPTPQIVHNTVLSQLENGLDALRTNDPGIVFDCFEINAAVWYCTTTSSPFP